VGALLLSDPILDVIRRELRRITPGAKIDTDEIKNVLMNEVIKRDVVEGEKADQAKRQINRAATRALRAKTPKDDRSDVAPEVIDVAPLAPSLAASAADD